MSEDCVASVASARDAAQRRLASMDTTSVSMEVWPQFHLGDLLRVVGITTNEDGTTTYTLARVDAE